MKHTPHPNSAKKAALPRGRGFTRRSVLSLLGVGATFGLGLAGSGVRELLTTPDIRQELRRMFEERMATPLPVQIFPECERSLEHALMVFDTPFFVRKSGGAANAALDALDQRHFQELGELLRFFPPYTTIHMTTSSRLERSMHEQLALLPADIRERIVPCPIGVKSGDTFFRGAPTKAWAQDVVEPVLFEGKPALVFPLNREYDARDPATALRDTVMPSLEKYGFHQFLAPVIFDGGNVISARVHGRSYLFIGSTNIGRTIHFYDTMLGISLSEEDAVTLFKHSFGADEVAVFGPTIEDYINMTDPSGGIWWETYQKLKKKAGPNDNVGIKDQNGKKVLTVYSDGDIVFWFNDLPYRFNSLSVGGVLKQSALSYHVDMVMAPHPGDRISLVDVQPLTEGEAKERADYYLKVHRAKGLSGHALVQEVEKDTRRDYLFVNYTISELRRTYAQLAAIYGAHNVFRFSSSALQARKMQAYANTLRFRDKTAGEYRAIMPYFPEQEHLVELILSQQGYSAVTQVMDTGRPERYVMAGHNRDARDHFKQRGYNVSPIRNTTYPSDGNTNCLVNILA